MGWVPIILAVAGFAFFIAVINYNSIKAHREAILMAFFNFCQTARARHTLIRSLQPDAVSSKCHVNHLANDFQLSKFNEYTACIRQEMQSIEDSRLQLEKNRATDPETRKVSKSLQVLNHRQHINIKVFNRKVREYNHLIEGYPTRLIAQATGRKQLRLRA